jgi:hypothetical protein
MDAPTMLRALGSDGHKWATAFCQKFPDVPHDEAVGWFCNAMMNMWDVTNSIITHSDEMLIDHMSNLVRKRDTWVELKAMPEADGE